MKLFKAYPEPIKSGNLNKEGKKMKDEKYDAQGDEAFNRAYNRAVDQAKLVFDQAVEQAYNQAFEQAKRAIEDAGIITFKGSEVR